MEPNTKKVKSGVQTTEFWATLSGLVVSVTVALGVVSAQDAGSLEGALTGAAAGILTVWANAKIILEYIKGRNKLKEEAMKPEQSKKQPTSFHHYGYDADVPES